MFRSRSWFGGGLWKPKNPHSLEHLKYLYNVLSKNQTVSENNRSLLVETLRSIAEILIWGDQNDSTVFDFFLEKNMLSFFLTIMKQKCGSYVCVQLLQTLNILFENIRNETSLYYLLSNNHVNSIIVHKFDFSDEEVMAYYISFLKTLSLKLNPHTIHFFYNEHTNDFPLYTEAIKFFNNSESMVRIAVRTLTLNVYKVDDKSMLKFIRDKTAAPYFSNLVWFIGNHVLELDNCITENAGSQEARPRLADLVAEHLDHLHYLNDILLLEIDDLNQVLTDHLLHRLLIPLYITSLDKNYVPKGKNVPPKVSSILAIFLLSQVFLIMTHSPLVRVLARILLNGNEAVFQIQPKNVNSAMYSSAITMLTKENENEMFSRSNSKEEEEILTSFIEDTPMEDSSEMSPEERRESLSQVIQEPLSTYDLKTRPFLSSIFDALDSEENDYAALFSLCLLHSLHQNKGINLELLTNFFNAGYNGNEDDCTNQNEEEVKKYNEQLVERLINIIAQTVKLDSKVRVVTLQLVISLLLKSVMANGDGDEFTGDCVLSKKHLECIEGARGENILLLQNYFNTDDIFLEVFEDENLEMSNGKKLSVEHLLMDSNLLLPPAGSPLTGITFDKRLPCGEVERSRRLMRVYFILRNLSLTLKKEKERYLPLTNTQNCVHVEDNLDLTNSDLVACTVITKDNAKVRRFLVIDVFQLILVEPSQKRSGWAVAKFVGFLQDIEVLGDKSDSRALHITVKTSPTCQRSSQTKTPILVAKFMFEDYIRCMAAKQRLIKGKQRARERKLHMIARLLEIGSSPSPPNSRRQQKRIVSRSGPLYTQIGKTVPGLAMAVVSDSSKGSANAEKKKAREGNQVSTTGLKSEEEIPLRKVASSSLQEENVHKSVPNHINFKEDEVFDSVLVSPTSGSEGLTTPQSETSFMTMSGGSGNNGIESSYETSTSSNIPFIPSLTGGGRRKKGSIETV